MIKQITDKENYLKICDKLSEVPNAMLTINVLLYNMAYNEEVSTYMSYDDDAPTGCVVLRYTKDITGVPVLFVLFQWRDSHYPELAKEFIDFASEQAREKGAKKIVFTNSRKDEVVQRATEKYGFKKVYSVFEKEVI